MSKKSSIVIKVNGKQLQSDVYPDMPLLYFLRNNLHLNGPKYGCGIEKCGACMVLMDGKAEPSCMIPIEQAAQYHIETLESLGTADRLDLVQQAFIEKQAAQCGYCLNGMIISAKSLLTENQTPSDDDIKVGLERVLCRCGTHSRMIAAVKLAVSKSESDQ